MGKELFLINSNAEDIKASDSFVLDFTFEFVVNLAVEPHRQRGVLRNLEHFLVVLLTENIAKKFHRVLLVLRRFLATVAVLQVLGYRDARRIKLFHLLK
jgi:hypothetical protein